MKSPMKRRSRWLRRVEVALWVMGFSLLGVALEATVERWSYQREQEQALLRLETAADIAPAATVPPPAAPVDAPAVLPPVEPPEPAAPAEPRPPEPPARAPRAAPAPDPAVLGRIEIPRLGIRAIVREGEDDATLDRAVGWIPGTARPGEEGNAVLAGHRDTFFRPLEGVEAGDRIRLFVPPETFEYRVDSIEIVKPTEVSVLESRGREELTLVTCFPFGLIGPAPHRFVVRATRVD